MVPLIAALRGLVGDPAVPDYARTDDELQTILDRHRQRFFQWPLTPEPNASYTFTEYSANGIGWWEDTVLLQSGQLTTLTPATADLIVGYWTFATSTGPPVYATGYSYDLHAAAVEVLEAEWALARSLVDFSSDGVSVSASQKASNLKDLLGHHSGKSGGGGGPAAPVTTVRLDRDDRGRRAY